MRDFLLFLFLLNKTSKFLLAVTADQELKIDLNLLINVDLVFSLVAFGKFLQGRRVL